MLTTQARTQTADRDAKQSRHIATPTGAGPLPVRRATHGPNRGTCPRKGLAAKMNHLKPLVLGSCVLLLVACTGVTRRSATPSESGTSSRGVKATTAARLGQPGCRPPSPISRWQGFPEVEGTSDQIQMWGLIMAQDPHNPLHVNEDVKIVWRITGSGALHLATLDPAGRAHRLQWGPDPHQGSTWTRPGSEWGAGYRFTQPGCWTLRATRGTWSASVWLQIGA